MIEKLRSLCDLIKAKGYILITDRHTTVDINFKHFTQASAIAALRSLRISIGDAIKKLDK